MKKKKNICCFNKKAECPFYQIKGIIDVGPKCGNCSQIDPEKVFSLLEYAFGKAKFIDKFIKDREDDAREEGRKEGREEREANSQKRGIKRAI